MNALTLCSRMLCTFVVRKFFVDVIHKPPHTTGISAKRWEIEGKSYSWKTQSRFANRIHWHGYAVESNLALGEVAQVIRPTSA